MGDRPLPAGPNQAPDRTVGRYQAPQPVL